MISLKNTLSAITNMLNDVPHYTLLWTNPNPTSEFSAQAISLDLSKYDAVEVVARQYRSDPYYFSSKTEVGKGGKLFCYGYDDVRALDARNYSVSTTGVSFQVGYSAMISASSGTAADGQCVPYKIYGIKFGGGGIRLSGLSSLRRWLYAKLKSHTKSDWGELGRKGNEVYGLWNADFVVAFGGKLHRSERWFAEYECQICVLFVRRNLKRRWNEYLEGETVSRFICNGAQCNSSSSFQRLKNFSHIGRRIVRSLGGFCTFRLMPKGVFA